MTEVLSANRIHHLAEPVSFGLLQEETVNTFMRLGDLLCENGIIPGHIKGMLTAMDGSIVLSVTRGGIVDLMTLGDMNPLTMIGSYEVTINVISLHPIKIDLSHLLQCLAQSVEEKQKRRNLNE